jgi:DNA primase
MPTDVERLRRDVSLSDTARGYGLDLQRDGDEWLAPCPFHSEKTASFTIFTGKDNVERFHCFGCGAKGDVLDFVRQIEGKTLPEAIAVLDGGPKGNRVEPRKVEVRDPYAGIEIVETPELALGRVKLYNPKRAGTEREWGSFVPAMIFPYRNLDGSLFGYVLRHNLPDGGKETPMVMRVRLPSGQEVWSRFPFPKPRPLYGVETIGDSRQVIVVEGEKCRDFLASATGRVVVTWAGGTLRGRNVVSWRDNDAPGRATMDEVGKIVTALDCTYRTLDLSRRAA